MSGTGAYRIRRLSALLALVLRLVLTYDTFIGVIGAARIAAKHAHLRLAST